MSLAPQLALVPFDTVQSVDEGEVVGVAAPLALVGERPLAATPRPSRLDEHAPTAYLASLSSGSRRAMKQKLEIVAALFGCDFYSMPWHDLRAAHTGAIRAQLAERFAPATANTVIAALKGTLQHAWLLKQIDTEDYHRAVNPKILKRIKGDSIPKGRMLETSELQAFFDACSRDASTLGVRDAAIFALAAGCGLRRASLVGLDMADYTPRDSGLLVRHAKGNKTFQTYVPREARPALADWLRVRGTEDGPLFLPTKQGRARHDGSRPEAGLVMRRLCDQSFWHILVKRVAEAQLDHVSPHDLRKTFISTMFDEGVDPSTIQKLVGHSNLATTVAYDRRGEKTKRAGADKMRLYTKRPRQRKLDL